jgi:hypothetical protein
VDELRFLLGLDVVKAALAATFLVASALWLASVLKGRLDRL